MFAMPGAFFTPAGQPGIKLPKFISDTGIMVSSDSGSLHSGDFSFIVPPLDRPIMLTIISVLGIIFCSLATILAIWGGAQAVSDITKGSQLANTGYILNLCYFAVMFLFMVSFLQITVGMLKRDKKARKSFLILATLIMLLEFVKIASLIYIEKFSLNYQQDFFKAVILIYLIVGAIYLRSKSAKTWFE
ncbi:MAG: hypothetical protein JW860_15600 [Sedimentisphaerales bacterium]|nr:hypothetical protein [Sedimentisphaerales bacterium]